MTRCVSCSSDVPADSRFCPQCGEEVTAEESPPTVTVPRKPAVAKPAYDSSSGTSSDSLDDARFTPGTMLLDRYRVVGLLGKGGMGEVYRADDLKLRQPVALKFLPEALAKNQSRLDRFHHEVRVARQVSHPNVCRVYDIGEADGHPFITMEYVSGEDLASVLRRMGRPSSDKALQIARQICAGLAAAHDKGVLHRDLKPHNIMIDERGRVRITDFGLAGFVEEFAGRDIQAGTPAYMSPEQLSGKEVSVKSDLYALGLVLFELFAGRRVFEGKNREELLRLRSETDVTTLSTRMEGVDSSVERVILRCLETHPAARPSSALAVAAALPGGDPLAAALAAGETPDPELVANAGDVGGLRPAIAIPLLLAAILGILGIGLLMSESFVAQAALSQPPEALTYRAQEILENLGYKQQPADSAYGFTANWNYLLYIEKTDDSPDRWDQLTMRRPAGIHYWYRQSPRQLLPPNSFSHITKNHPPFIVSGMASIMLDTDGRLVELAVIPPQTDDIITQNTRQFSDWESLFEEADLDMSLFQSSEPVYNAHLHCDQRVAWDGYFDDQPDVPIRIEAGSYRDKPNFFKITGPWSQTTPPVTSSSFIYKQVFNYVFVIIILLVIFGSIVLAWKNLKLKRGDRKGAFRASLFYLLCGFLAWLLGTTHINDPWYELDRNEVGTGRVLYYAGFLWLLYMAFEPYVRRRWPHTLISWTRLLMGRFRDPLVGRDILIGCVFGIGFVFSWRLSLIVPTWTGELPPLPVYPFTDFSMMLSSTLSSTNLLSELIKPWYMFIAIWHMFVIFALRILLRKQWIAVVAYVMIFSVMFSMIGPVWSSNIARLLNMLCYATWLILLALVLLRFGLLALVVAMLFHMRFIDLRVTFDFSAWYASGSLIILLFLTSIAVYGFHTALAGRPLFKDELLEG